MNENMFASQWKTCKANIQLDLTGDCGFGFLDSYILYSRSKVGSLIG